LNHLPLYREPFAAVLQAAHRLAPRGFLRLDDLEGEPYLHRVHCEHEALSHRALSAPVFESDRDDWILAMAAAGLGFGLIPAHSADYPGTVALRLAAPAIAREISLVTPRARPHPPAVGALVHEAMRLAAMPEAVAPAAEPVLLEAVAAQ
jgi:LysR family hydrogen peroxide-inducible transcriptional activator